VETLQLLVMGFSVALQPTYLLFAFLGCLIGTVVGVLPGVGPLTGPAILIPITFVLDATGSIIMLAAIYYGAMYGGTITSVLINVPGEAASAVTCIEGYPMAKQGRGGAALASAAIGSFVGGTIAVFALVLVALPLTSIALKFGPPEFFGLMLIGLTLVTGLAGRSISLAMISAIFGLLLGLVGMDPVFGAPRFTFGFPDLLDGVGLVPVAMGLFGVGEVLLSLERESPPVIRTPMSSLVLTREDLKTITGPILRGTAIGLGLGFIPGVGALVPTFMSYVIEKKVSKTPEKFGTGMIEGVAGPETANNAYANAALIPLFTLGIPGSAVVAVLMGAFMMHGLFPGPFLFVEHPKLVWAVIASLYIGNLILLILNLPLIPIWVSLLRVPYSVLGPLILGFCILGCYSISSSLFDVGLMLIFGIVGYLMKKVDIPLSPAILTLILGPLMDKALRQSLELSGGEFSIFFTRPISLGLLAVAVLILITTILGSFSRIRGGDSVV
jgi:putative tricarboxylic transport membrane protein